jgi:hypothetical protein
MQATAFSTAAIDVAWRPKHIVSGAIARAISFERSATFVGDAG